MAAAQNTTNEMNSIPIHTTPHYYNSNSLIFCLLNYNLIQILFFSSVHRTAQHPPIDQRLTFRCCIHIIHKQSNQLLIALAESLTTTPNNVITIPNGFNWSQQQASSHHIGSINEYGRSVSWYRLSSGLSGRVRGWPQHIEL